MFTQQSEHTLGQVVPKYKEQPQKQNIFSINGCTVSFSSNAKSTDEPLMVAKEILLSSYKTRIAKG